ncbi:MAG: YaaR family protein [Clostridiaceae bacterium]|nr:YaaR family protein [Clostridiaceae bacterium]
MALKIDGGSGRKPHGIRVPAERDAGRISQKTGTQFGNHMDRHFSQAQDEELKKMAQEIEKQGKILSEHIDIYELKKYKKLVMEFLSEAVRSSGRFSKESFVDRRGRHRVFALVKTINEKLEQLTADVLSSEKDNLKILGRIEDIRGLVLDLIL